MSRSGTLVFFGIVAVTLLAATPAGAAGRVPGGGGLLPRPNPEWEMRKRMVEPAKAPYPMTFSEQVAQSLGVRKDGVNLYEARDNARNSYAPSVSLGGTTLRLRWRQ